MTGKPINIDPTVDFAFKQMLGSPEHYRVTLHFLNSVLGGDPRITHVEFQNPVLEKEFDDDKYSVLDVRVTDDLGRHFDVEMQVAIPAGMKQRLAYYTSGMYFEQLTEGQNYPLLRPAISICVLDAVMFPKLDDLHLDFRLREMRHAVTLTDDLQIHIIQLPKYVLPIHNGLIIDPIEKWAWFLKNAAASSAEEISRRLGDEEFTEAAGVLNMISRTPEQRAAYQSRLKAQRDEEARMTYAADEGLKRGMEEGMQQGRNIGELIGIIKLSQQLLGETVTSDAEFSDMENGTLKSLADDLQRRLLDRS